MNLPLFPLDTGDTACYYGAVVTWRKSMPAKILGKQSRGNRGQILTEYALMLVAFVAVTCLLVLLLAAFTEYGWRLVSLVAWEPFT